MGDLLRAVGHDLLHAARQVRRQWAFSAAATTTLVLPTIALATLFSLFDAIAVRPLPIPRPDELVHLAIADRPGAAGQRFSYATFQRLKFEQQALRDPFGYTGGGVYPVEAGSRIVDGVIAAVSPEFFSALGIRPATGRPFTVADAPPQGEPAHVAVLSSRLARRLFDRDDAAVGKALDVRGRTLTVVGVLPDQFTGLLQDVGNDLYIPLTLLPFIGATPSGPPAPSVASLFGRLRPGVSLEQARASLTATWPRVLMDTMAVTPTPRTRTERESLTLIVEHGGRGLSLLRAQYERPLLLLTLLAAVLLIVACVNLGGLMFARIASSQVQWSVRLALGATRARLVRLLVFESAMLAGAAAGVAALLLPTLSRLAGRALSTSGFLLNRWLVPDERSYAFLAAATLLVAAVMGLVAAGALRGRASRGLVQSATVSVRQLPARVAVSLQVCGLVVLLFAAALFVGSLVRLRTLDFGFRSDGLVFTRAWQLPGPPRVYDEQTYYPALVEHLAALPGVRSVALSHYFPGYFNSPFVPQIDVKPSGLDGALPVRAQREFISPRFFETIGASILQGRDFTWSDRAGAPPVAIISRTLAARLFPDGGPIGSRMLVGTDAEQTIAEVVGVSNDVTVGNLRQPALPVIFRPRLQEPLRQRIPIVVVNAGPNTAAVLGTIPPAIRSMGHEYVREIQTVDEHLRQSTGQETLLALVSMLFGGAAAIAAVLGLLALVAYSVTRRTREIGIRVAIGASPVDVVRLVLAQALVPVTTGVIAGVPCAIATGKLAESLLFEVDAGDPWLAAAVAFLTLACAVCASAFPALRAARVNPVSAVRAD